MIRDDECRTGEIVVDLEGELFFECEGRDDLELGGEMRILSRFKTVLLRRIYVR